MFREYSYNNSHDSPCKLGGGQSKIVKIINILLNIVYTSSYMFTMFSV